MNIAERNRIVVEHMPIVAKLVKSMRLSPDLQEDVLQAGHLAAIRAVDSWQKELGELTWWIKFCVRRDAGREVERLTSTDGHVSIDDMLDEGDDSSGEAEEAFLVNQRNELTERVTLNDELIDEVFQLEGIQRILMITVLEGHTVSEAARRLKISQSAADRLYQKSVDELRAKLGIGG